MVNVLKMFSLKGKVALVTGGEGLYGQQVVAAVAAAGAVTYTASPVIDALRRLAARHKAQGRDVRALWLDQGDEKSILSVRDEIMRRSRRIDILINNAVARPMRGGWTDEAKFFDESMHVNATGIFMVTRAIGETMIKRGSGSIINIASIQGLVGVEKSNYTGTKVHGYYPDYFFHKGGLINFTRFCASYFGRHNVRVNSISPGGLRTPNHPPRFVRQYCERTQLGRMAGQTDLMGAIVFLASDASAYVTGANIPVDGGYTAK